MFVDRYTYMVYVYVLRIYIAWCGHKTYAVAMNNKSNAQLYALYAKYFYLPQLHSLESVGRGEGGDFAAI